MTLTLPDDAWARWYGAEPPAAWREHVQAQINASSNPDDVLPLELRGSLVPLDVSEEA